MSAGVLPLSVPFDPTPVESLLRELVLSPDECALSPPDQSDSYLFSVSSFSRLASPGVSPPNSRKGVSALSGPHFGRSLRNLSAAATELKAKHVRVVLVDQERNVRQLISHQPALVCSPRATACVLRCARRQYRRCNTSSLFSWSSAASLAPNSARCSRLLRRHLRPGSGNRASP